LFEKAYAKLFGCYQALTAGVKKNFFKKKVTKGKIFIIKKKRCIGYKLKIK
jgi:hypothetical protein